MLASAFRGTLAALRDSAQGSRFREYPLWTDCACVSRKKTQPALVVHTGQQKARNAAENIQCHSDTMTFWNYCSGARELEFEGSRANQGPGEVTSGISKASAATKSKAKKRLPSKSCFERKHSQQSDLLTIRPTHVTYYTMTSRNNKLTTSTMSSSSSSSRPSSKQLLVLLGLSTAKNVSAYQPQVLAGRGGVWGGLPYKGPDSQLDAKPAASTAAASRPTYDLGLGKNRPVMVATEDSSTLQPKTDDIQQAVAYLVEHDGDAANYPSPDMVRLHRERLAQAAAVAKTTTKQAITKKQPLPIAYTHQERVLVMPQQEANGRYVVDRATTNDLDMNTAWVQLLYLEQLKLVSANAGAGPN